MKVRTVWVAGNVHSAVMQETVTDSNLLND